MESWLQDIVANNSDLAYLTSLGQSHEGRDIWLVEVSDVSRGEAGL